MGYWQSSKLSVSASQEAIPKRDCTVPMCVPGVCSGDNQQVERETVPTWETLCHLDTTVMTNYSEQFQIGN